MTHNDVFRRLRYMFEQDDDTMIAVFAAADHAVTKEQVRSWRAQEDAPHFQPLGDTDLALFLNGLIIEKRGKRPGPQPEPELRLDNNIIARKLKIALNLQGEDLIAALNRADFTLSNHELSAFFRKPGRKHYRVMNDQVLRYLLRGLQMKYRPSDGAADEAGSEE